MASHQGLVKRWTAARTQHIILLQTLNTFNGIRQSNKRIVTALLAKEAV